MLGRLTINILMPIITVVIFDDSCFALWLQLWSPCAEHPQSFDVKVSMEPSLDHTPGWWTPMGYFLSQDFPHTVATHSEICDHSWSENNKCSRGVLAVVGQLIFSKLIFLSFLGPGATLCLSLPAVTRVLKDIWQRAFPGTEFIWYRGDVELAFVLMFVEYSLSLGFLIPLLLPLSALGLVMNCCVYHTAVEQLKLPIINAARPSLKYLYVSRAMGILFTNLVLCRQRPAWDATCVRRHAPLHHHRKCRGIIPEKTFPCTDVNEALDGAAAGAGRRCVGAQQYYKQYLEQGGRGETCKCWHPRNAAHR